MGDTSRGLVIGIAAGLIGGIFVSGAAIGVINIYIESGPAKDFINTAGPLIGTVLGGIIGAVGAYRMLQNLAQERGE